MNMNGLSHKINVEARHLPTRHWLKILGTFNQFGKGAVSIGRDQQADIS